MSCYGPGGGGSITGGGGFTNEIVDWHRGFDDPFLLPSSETMPDNLHTALDLCLFLYFLNPQYRQASSRVCRHFITDFDYPGEGSKEEKDELDDFLHYTIKLPLFLADMGDEWAAYGNAFCRIHFPFDRFLVDPRVHTEYSLDLFGNSARYLWKEMAYEVPDPLKPGKRVRLKFRDRKSNDVSRIRLRILNPRFVTIQHCLISGSSRYIYRFEPFIIDDVKKGRLWIVNEMPMSMLRTISKEQDFAFDTDSIFHFRAPTVSGVSNYGWGIPGTIANYRNIHQIQVYRKIDECIGLDYLLPFRLFSPSLDMQLNDMVQNVLLSRWSGEVRKIIRERRRNKFAMHALPFPVNYQEFGANGKEYVPKDLLEYQTGVLLDGMGYPQELFKGSLQYLQVPTGLRLFENSFLFVFIGYNNFSQWVVRRVRAYLNQPPMEITLQRPSLADSLERKQLIFQLAAMGEISRETGYNALGIDDAVAEVKKRLEEDSQIQREQFRMQQEMQKEVETGTLLSPEEMQGQDPNQGGGGGAPAGPGTTPLDVQGDAQQLAEYWLQIPSSGERSKAMQAVKAQDEQLYALAKAKMEEMRSQGASQGRAQVSQQSQQGGGGGAPPPSGAQPV